MTDQIKTLLFIKIVVDSLFGVINVMNSIMKNPKRSFIKTLLKHYTQYYAR